MGAKKALVQRNPVRPDLELRIVSTDFLGANQPQRSALAQSFGEAAARDHHCRPRRLSRVGLDDQPRSQDVDLLVARIAAALYCPGLGAYDGVC